MSFTQQLRRDTAQLRQQILDMPFNRDLAAGTLPQEVFRGYIVQDAHYLEGFARALAMAAAKAPDADAVAQLAGSAIKAISVERGLHGEYMAQFGVSAEEYEATEISEACDHYVSFLLRMVATDDFAVGLTALLPCFWIYHEVGQKIAAEAVPGNRYQAWIDTYASEDFADGVQRMLELIDRTAAASSDATRARMQRSFARSCWHEWHFWDSAYHMRGWLAPDAEPSAKRMPAIAE
ncbi:thiaminase (transcriptional activator TenA) [Paracoccus isoporae]|uniref:Aminopyrimidine aminohydrolase n=1 Tax=Paracoccus isoporae TaxID=591205 RepID=A0A1G6U6P7_9RHOB|nr:thiaminase II [Paracoccus isoporae]SDD36267.1 thiaminase (transcriptional activator TenA) [Paracoccus isoporae]